MGCWGVGVLDFLCEDDHGWNPVCAFSSTTTYLLFRTRKHRAETVEPLLWSSGLENTSTSDDTLNRLRPSKTLFCAAMLAFHTRTSLLKKNKNLTFGFRLTVWGGQRNLNPHGSYLPDLHMSLGFFFSSLSEDKSCIPLLLSITDYINILLLYSSSSSPSIFSPVSHILMNDSASPPPTYSHLYAPSSTCCSSSAALLPRCEMKQRTATAIGYTHPETSR